ncbi:HAMP domain-containing protein [Herbaspirillum seropedicae]|uniref:histidine kinase n=1 Tax=Herbaspirillum seropedicae (strain SmR1) TaxID=757424 RepID=D8IPY6_HERSS|nr:ATP-binding protein [Herbaspirillum seropedicae]ADJ63032.1 two component sensor histidine kinase protein [Herbaspirillum seropedicae SmR1]AKN65114.1 histidine kinase [Herbaspirillum seropedicae]MDR6396845.1 signal transduction histidine kinase [Herbaspirillum seropedicae]NQE32203.1 histidine kinase [Herbaspirillum seropedicae]UMU21061.1 HAMP domain-containing protein [Herbaspirillum seropedicae]
MKNFLGSIGNRIFFLLLGGIVVAVFATNWLAGNERRNTLRELRFQHLADRVEQIVQAVDNIPPAQRPIVLQAASNFGFEARMVEDMNDAIGPDASPSPSTSPLTEMLQARLGEDRKIAVQRESECPPLRTDDARAPRRDTCRVIYISLHDQALMRLRLHQPGEPPALRARAGPGGPASLFGLQYILLFLVLIAMLAWLVARMATRPIRQLAQAASRLGSDIDHAPLAETGPTEIRQAAHAFNAMQARIRRQIQHRTHMLAAITHDLQTPLTRMRLRLEKVSDPGLQQKLIDDLGVMHGMVREGLDLARSMDSSEKIQALDIDSLLDSVCADAADAGQDVALQGSTRAFVMAQPGALRRCLTNLIDNACKYGKSARVSIALEQQKIAIRIRDQGPGIPESELEAVFEPFYRLEASRSRDTGGTGLGLTIALNIAENHHGQLRLRNLAEGGLEVLLELPPMTPAKNR